MPPVPDSPTMARRRRVLCARVATIAHELGREEWADVRPNAVAYLLGLERDIREGLTFPASAERRTWQHGPQLARTEWIAVAHLLQWILDAGVVAPLPRSRIEEIRERISGQLH